MKATTVRALSRVVIRCLGAAAVLGLDVSCTMTPGRADAAPPIAVPVAVKANPSSSTPVGAIRPRGLGRLRVARDPTRRTVFYDFAHDDPTLEHQDPFGTITFGAKDPAARDGRAAALLFKGGTTAVGPTGNAAEIETVARLGFGKYRFRTRLATCRPSEELVNGLFLYQNGVEVTLWTFTDGSRVPKEPATMRFNLWHPRRHWNQGGAVQPAKNDAVLSLDWFAFTAGR